MKPPEIIVGVDGSPAARAAVEWAAAEARRHSAELVVVHVYDWRVVGSRAPVAGGYADAARQHAEEIVAAAVADARAFEPEVTVRGEAVLGAAGPTLIAASRTGATIVVGNRGRGGFASLLLGSVSQQVATHAAGPVVVVRGRPDITDGPVVVGTDGSAEARHAIGVAFEEAAVRGAGVDAVRVYLPASPPWGPDVAPYVEDAEERRETELQLVAEDVAPWREKFPDVPVETTVVAGHPAEALIGVSSSARLIVVGTRGHGGFTGLMLGSVGLHLLHHAECPVLIARGVGTTA